MRSIAFAFLLFAVVGSDAFAAGADLTPVETRWLAGIRPVVEFAREAGMPLDIIVQPQPSPGAAPLALGYLDGRCKLVFSMRGNPEAQSTLDAIAPELLDDALELMAAHELGHCRRYLSGIWHGVPANFAQRVPGGLTEESRTAFENRAAARREEAYGDLVGLAWTLRHHPGRFGELQAWLESERSRDIAAGAPHDTLAWIVQARGGEAFGANSAAGGSIFDAAERLWTKGLPTAE